MQDSETTDAFSVVAEQGRALLQAVPDLVFLLRIDGTYVDIFQARDEDLYIPREALIGKTVSEVLPPPVGDDCMAAIRGLASEHDVTLFEYMLPIDGRERHFEGRVTRCGTGCVLVLVRDFTEQREIESALTEANAALSRRADQLQRLERELTMVEQRERQRMAHVLHDSLQQLLVGAKCSVATLGKRAGSDGNRKVVDDVTRILNEAIRQSQLLTTDLCPPIIYEGSFAQALQWIKKQFAHLHRLSVDVAISGSGPTDLAEDIRIVLFNSVRELLFNVVKHADVDSARVTVAVSGGNELCIQVIDTGQGFDAADITDPEQGLGGFGLFAIRERLQSLGGTMTIASAPGAGCTAALTVPISFAPRVPDFVQHAGDTPAQQDEEIVAFATADHGTDRPDAIRVLLVDDHAIMRQGLAQLLLMDPAFCIVGEASSGEMAISLVRETSPDVILMDISMPGIGGVAATRKICNAHPDVKVIALSMYDERDRGDEMRDAGAVGYVTKSEAAEMVAAEIHACCRR